jgi:mRNA interferase MazF
LVTRGDIYWLDLPHEGRRPVCVLTRQEAIPVLRHVVVALVTRTIREIPTEVRLSADDGMSTDCAVSLDNLRTVPRALLTERIARLGPDKQHAICRSLVTAMAC